MATRERRGEGGQGLIEYVLVLALIALVAVAILTVFGHQLSAFTDKVLTIVGVGADAGTITVTDDEGRAVSTTYPAQE